MSQEKERTKKMLNVMKVQPPSSQQDEPLSVIDVDPMYVQRAFSIEQQAIAKEKEMVEESERMSKELNFDDITKAFADYQPIGSAKGIKVAKKKKGKKAIKPEAKKQD